MPLLLLFPYVLTQNNFITYIFFIYCTDAFDKYKFVYIKLKMMFIIALNASLNSS